MGLTYTKLRVTQGSRPFQQHNTTNNPTNAESRMASAAPPWYEEFFSVIGDYISGFRTAYPLEAQVSFRRPLKWLTHFSEDNLQNVNFGVGYQKKQNADGSPIIFSEDVGPDGRPLFLLTRNNANKWEVEVWSMEHIANLLNMSSDGVVREIGGCFEACNDPVGRMFDNHELDHVEDENHAEAIQGIIMRMEEAGVDANMRRTYMLLMQFDILFLHRKFMYRIGDDEYQQPDEVYAEIRMLQHMSKFEEISPLISLEYLLEKSEFGWRAPLWRQVVGDVCYLIVTLHDEEEASEPLPVASDAEENHKSAFNVVVMSEDEDPTKSGQKYANSSRGKVGANMRDSGGGGSRKRPRRQQQRLSITCNVTGVFQNGILKASEAAADATAREAAALAESTRPKKPDTLTVQAGGNTTDDSGAETDADSDARSARSVMSNASSAGGGRHPSRQRQRKRKHRAARDNGPEEPQQLRSVAVNLHDRESFAQLSENYASISSLLRAKSPIFAKQLHSAQARYERLRTEERRKAMHDKTKRSLDDMVDKNHQQYLRKKDGKIYARPISAAAGGTPTAETALSTINASKSVGRRKNTITGGGGGDDAAGAGGDGGGEPPKIIDEPMSSSDEDDRDLEDSKGAADMFVAELPPAYWQIQKLCRYIKGGNETATLIALVAINDFNLNDDVTWLALRDSNCLEVLINILDVDGNTDCKIAALRTLKEICKNLSVARVVLQCEGLSSFINILDDPCLKLKALAAECLAYVARIRKARYYIRRDGGISALVGLMDIEMLANGSTVMALGGGGNPTAGSGARSNAGQPSNIFNVGASKKALVSPQTPAGENSGAAGPTAPTGEQQQQPNSNVTGAQGLTSADGNAGSTGETASAVPANANPVNATSTFAHHQHRAHTDLNTDVVEVARGGAFAIWSCVRSVRNKIAVREAGGIPLLASLLKIDDDEVLVPVIGTLQECASEAIYRTAIRTEGIIIDLVRHLHRSQNPDIQMNAASAIFKCGDDSLIRSMVREHGGLRPLKDLLENPKNYDNKPLMVALTGAVWKCAAEPENVTILRDLGCVALLISLAASQPEEVLINVMGTLAEMSRDAASRAAIRKFNGLQSMIEMLSNTNQQLLVNVTRAVGLCAQDAESLLVVERMDGVRLLWSLLKNANKDVKANAAWALCPCIENNKDAGDLVRSFVGGLELVVSLLRTDNDNVLAATCACVASIAKDEENLAVITDQGVVQLLSRLVSHKDDVLRAQLSMAVARCCKWGDNRRSFGDNNAVAPLVGYLKKPNVDPDVKLQATKALFELSKDPGNCCVIHKNGAVRYLLTFLADDNEQLQAAAAGCLRHMRYLALANLSEFYHVTAKSE